MEARLSILRLPFEESKRVRKWSHILISGSSWPYTQNETTLTVNFHSLS